MSWLRFVSAVFAVFLASGASCAPGTEFWAVLSDDGLLKLEGDLSIPVGNPNPVAVANVIVETESGIVDVATVAPLSSHVFSLGLNRKVAGTTLVRCAYKLTSDIPIHAYQYINFTRENNAASLLLDRKAFGDEYMLLALPSDGGWPERTDSVTVVAPGPTRVTVVPSAATRAGASIPALAAGTPYTVDLSAFDVLQIGAAGTGDLTGTTVSATAPVKVFSVCAYCHLSNSVHGSGADNVQELMPPLKWWGKEIVAVASNPLTIDINVWRILASEDGTTVSTDPPVPGTPTVLNRGQFIHFESTTDFAVTASKPVLVGRYNTNGNIGVCSYYCGDPALAVMTPPQRFFSHAVFALPAEVPMSLLVDVVARSGTTVVVDGQAVPQAQFLAVGSSGFLHAQVPLGVGFATHTIEADRPIAAYVWQGWSDTAASFPVDIGLDAGLAPTCEAGGPYFAPCTGAATSVPLDGTASSDPENAQLGFRWSSPSPAVVFDDPTSPTPVATVAGVGTFQADLEVDDGGNYVSCATTIQVDGDSTTPPELDRLNVPLLLVKQVGGIRFSWQDVGGAPMSYNVYEGTMKLIDSHAPLACNVQGNSTPPARRELSLTPGPGSRYFLVSAANCAAEGPSGLDPAQSTCPP